MGHYGEEGVRYKAKLTGQLDARVVAPKGRKKKVAKPWCVALRYIGSSWSPERVYRSYYVREEDARKQHAKIGRSSYAETWLEYEGKVTT